MSRLLIATVVAGLVVGCWLVEAVLHRRRMDRLAYRVHVNGIRGKSTVTRLIAGAFRGAGIATVAKSTGTAAALIGLDGQDELITRRGPATILEQIRVARRVLDKRVEALIVECMALMPAYQLASERSIVRSNIGVLTNVRHDHQDVMGESLEEIATSLLGTCPRDGILVTAEHDPRIVELIDQVALRNRTVVIYVEPEEVSDAELARFTYVSFKENVAIALAVASLAGIDRETALAGMVEAPPDPGVLKIKEFWHGETWVTWANLFAVNDRESMISAMNRLTDYQSSETVTIGILNNRSDREQRALQFADIAVDDLSFDRLVTFGAYERRVTKRAIERGFDPGAIINLGDDRQPAIDEVMEGIVTAQAADHVLLVGLVNVHTEQAEALVRHLDQLEAGAVIEQRLYLELLDVGALTEALLRGDDAESQRLASAIGYELDRDVDVDGRAYRMAWEEAGRESGRGWRTLIVADHGDPLLVEVNRSARQTEEFGLNVFRDLGARVLLVPGPYGSPHRSDSLGTPIGANTDSDVVVASVDGSPSAMAINRDDETWRPIELDDGLPIELLRRIDAVDRRSAMHALVAP